jgi:hypothetical protein
MGLFLESERIVSRSSHSQVAHAYWQFSYRHKWPFGWRLWTNVCILSVGTIPHNFLYKKYVEYFFQQVPACVFPNNNGQILGAKSLDSAAHYQFFYPDIKEAIEKK